MALLFSRHCFFRPLGFGTATIAESNSDRLGLLDLGRRVYFLASAKSTLLALLLYRIFPIAIPLILSAKTFAKIIMHLTVLCVNFLHYEN